MSLIDVIFKKNALPKVPASLKELVGEIRGIKTAIADLWRSMTNAEGNINRLDEAVEADENTLGDITKHKVYLTGSTLSQSMMSKENTIYVVKDDLTLSEGITIPANCVLEFEGGSIGGEHTLTGTNTGIQARLVKIFSTDVTLAGSWSVAEAYPEWFGAKGDGVKDDTTAFVKTCTVFKNVKGRGIYALTGTTLSDVNIKADIISISNEGVTLNNNVEFRGRFISKHPTVDIVSRGIKVVGNNNYIHETEFSALDNRCTIAIDVFNTAYNLKISKCVFKPDYKIDIMTSGNDMIIEDCVFEEHTATTLSPITEYGNGIKLSQNAYDSVTSDNGNNIIISNNTILNHGDNPIDCFTGASNVRITGNYIVTSEALADIEIKVTNGDYGTNPNFNYIITGNLMVGGTNLRISRADELDLYNFIISNNIFTCTSESSSSVIIEGVFNYSIESCVFKGTGTNSALNIYESGTDASVHSISNCHFDNFSWVIFQQFDNYSKIYLTNCTIRGGALVQPYTHVEVFVNNCDIYATRYIGQNIQGKLCIVNSRLTAPYLFSINANSGTICLTGCKLMDTTRVFLRSSSEVKFKYTIIGCDLSESTELGSMVTETIPISTAS